MINCINYENGSLATHEVEEIKKLDRAPIRLILQKNFDFSPMFQFSYQCGVEDDCFVTNKPIFKTVSSFIGL